MKKPLRIGYGRIFHEANAFSPLPTTLDNFKRFHWLDQGQLREASGLMGSECPGYMRHMELSGFAFAAARAGAVERVPLMSALAVPSGPITVAAFAALKERLVDSLRSAGHLDGVYLALHGSMRVVGMTRQPEIEIVEAVREELGDLPIAISLDLHANLTRELVDLCDVLVTFRTNPHRDLFSTGRRAGNLLIQTLRGQAQPRHTWRKLPMVLGGGITIDFLAPMRSIFARARAIERAPGVMSASICMVHPFSDAPDLGWAVHVTTDNDPELGERYADELAELCWGARHDPLPEILDAKAGFKAARDARVMRRLGPITLVDTADVVGTGSCGGNTHLIAEWLSGHSGLRVYIPLHDPGVIEELATAEIGAEVEVTLRGTPGLEAQPEPRFKARLLRREDTDFGRSLVLDDGELAIAVSERPPMPIRPGFWSDLGLDPRKADVIVQKSFFHYRMFYVATSFHHIGVSSSGPSSFDNVRALSLDPPVFPNVAVEEWQSFDRYHRLRAS